MPRLERMSRRSLLIAALLGPIALAAGAFADDKATAKVVPAAEAKDHLGETCTVELTVRLTKNVPDKVCYLDSEKDYKDPKNLAVIIAAKDLIAFQKAGIDDPSVFYKGKVIRVTGKVILESEQVRIHVEEPGRIEVIEKKD